MLHPLRELLGAPRPRVVVVAAHPDDETIGASCALRTIPDIFVLHATDGAPRRPDDARAAGCATREAYARARRAECNRALAHAGVARDRLVGIGIPDQEAGHQLVRLTRALAAIFSRLAPDAVITHPYEGGHPDHDAVAFATHHALALVRRRRGRAPRLVEMTSYHRRGGGLATDTFVGGDSGVLVPLGPAGCRVKQRMFAAYATQRAVLAGFSIATERYRRAPTYDFGTLPNGGVVHYGDYDWGMTPATWLDRASAARAALGCTPRETTC